MDRLFVPLTAVAAHGEFTGWNEHHRCIVIGAGSDKEVVRAMGIGSVEHTGIRSSRGTVSFQMPHREEAAECCTGKTKE